MTKGIRDKVVVVTAASSGLGEAVALSMSQPPDIDINESLYRPTKREL
jgi:hypothetical protein